MAHKLPAPVPLPPSNRYFHEILVADDEAIFGETISGILSQWPEHQVTLVEDGEAVWPMLNDTGRSFDVAFLDVKMPGMGGPDRRM